MQNSWLVILTLCGAVLGCSKHKEPQLTPVPVVGYPYPFGTPVRRLLGKDPWEASVADCRGRYEEYKLENPSQHSLWSEYSKVVVTADTLGLLQGFSATRNYSSPVETRAGLIDLLNTLRRRYGSQTDSLARGRVVLSRRWEDRSGNTLEVIAEGTLMTVVSASGNVNRDCNTARPENKTP